jgi:prevent-host-death family protein
MVITAEIGAEKLSELVKQVQAGNEILLTQDAKPVARLVPAGKAAAEKRAPLQVRSLPGHKVLTPVISQEDIAEEMFGRQ